MRIRALAGFIKDEEFETINVDANNGVTVMYKGVHIYLSRKEYEVIPAWPVEIAVKTTLDNVYTVKEAAERLRVHVNSVYQLVEQKKIRAVRVGKKILISHKALEEFLNGE